MTSTSKTPAILNRIQGFVGRQRQARKMGARVVDRFRYSLDLILARLMRYVPAQGRGNVRSLWLRSGGQITYRLNRGDIQSLREVFAEDHYNIHGLTNVNTFVDLGANIGLTTLKVHFDLKPKYVVCVEPSPSNVKLIERNLSLNGLQAVVLTAAVGDHDGLANFQFTEDSNVGRVLSDGEVQVRLVSMQTVVGQLPHEVRIDLMKIDIEGSEAQILEGDVDWLTRVDRLVMEIHADRVDPVRCVQVLDKAGLEYIGGPKNEIWWFSRVTNGSNESCWS